MTELEARITLNMLSEIGSIRLKRLLDFFKSASAVFEADEEEFKKIEGLPKTFAPNLKLLRKSNDLEKELELIEKEGVDVVSFSDSRYPLVLKEIYDPPPLLYVKGKLEQASANIAVVGSRRASIYGLKMAEQFSYELASRGITVVSGLARGIDSAAARGALKAVGKTIAVLGSGLNRIYPPENKKLFEEIVDSGAVISEFSMLTKPLAGNFPRRNRIISGLSLGVVVVEAAKRSGALITANAALEQGREVFALPGKADSPTSWGTNQLIKDGAKLVDDVKDIIFELKINLSQVKDGPKQNKSFDESLNLPEEEKRILGFIGDEPVLIGEIARLSQLDTAKLFNALTRLEIRKIIRQLPGKRFVKT